MCPLPLEPPSHLPPHPTPLFFKEKRKGHFLLHAVGSSDKSGTTHAFFLSSSVLHVEMLNRVCWINKRDVEVVRWPSWKPSVANRKFKCQVSYSFVNYIGQIQCGLSRFLILIRNVNEIMEMYPPQMMTWLDDTFGIHEARLPGWEARLHPFRAWWTWGTS